MGTGQFDMDKNSHKRGTFPQRCDISLFVKKEIAGQKENRWDDLLQTSETLEEFSSKGTEH